jgi:hypothetical protein
LRDKITNPDKGTSHAAVQKNATMANPSHGNSNNRSKEEEAALTKRLEALKPPDHDGQSQQRGGAGGPSPGGAANAAGGMPNSHGSVPGGGSRLPPLTSELSNEDRKFQDALSDGVAGVVNSQKGSAEPPPAASRERTRGWYTKENALKVKNMHREFAEGADEVAGASLENSRPAAAGQDKANESPRSDGVLPVKKPVPPSTPPAPLIRALKHRNLRKTPASGTVLIKDQSRNNSSDNASLGSGQQAAKTAFQESSTSSLPGDARSKLKAQQSIRKGAGPGAQTSSEPHEAHFQKRGSVDEQRAVENEGDMYVQDDDDEIRNRGLP